MKILYRTPKIIDVFVQDTETPQHGWGKWSKFRIYEKNKQKKVILLDGNRLSNEDMQSLMERLS